jgi:hypothetical protein
MIAVLDRGLTFIPSPTRVPLKFIIECKQRNIRNLNLRDFFQNKDNSNYDPNAFANKFIPKSSWNPPLKDISKETQASCLRIANYTQKLIRNRLTKSKDGTNVICQDLHTKGLNLTKQEFQAIVKLRNEKSIIIKPADKGGAIVILDKTKYKEEGLRQLLNKNYYEPIEGPNWLKNVQDINIILKDIHGKQMISDKQLQYLIAKIPKKT